MNETVLVHRMRLMRGMSVHRVIVGMETTMTKKLTMMTKRKRRKKVRHVETWMAKKQRNT